MGSCVSKSKDCYRKDKAPRTQEEEAGPPSRKKNDVSSLLNDVKEEHPRNNQQHDGPVVVRVTFEDEDDDEAEKREQTKKQMHQARIAQARAQRDQRVQDLASKKSFDNHEKIAPSKGDGSTSPPPAAVPSEMSSSMIRRTQSWCPEGKKGTAVANVPAHTKTGIVVANEAASITSTVSAISAAGEIITYQNTRRNTIGDEPTVEVVLSRPEETTTNTHQTNTPKQQIIAIGEPSMDEGVSTNKPNEWNESSTERIISPNDDKGSSEEGTTQTQPQPLQQPTTAPAVQKIIPPHTPLKESEIGKNDGNVPVVEESSNSDAAPPNEPSFIPDGPIRLQNIQDPQFLRIANKLHKKLNHDPWDEFKKYYDEDVCEFIQKHPETCKVKYSFDHFSGELFPLSIMCTMGASETAVKLAYEAYPEAKDKCDLWIGTPLHYACSYKAKKTVVTFFMDNEPVMLQRINQFGRTPLHMACLFKASTTTISLLLKRYPQALDIHDKDGYTPLHLACENGASAEVAMLLLMTASPQYAVSRSQNESTPLHLACSKTNAKSLVTTLLEANPEAAKCVDHLGQTPLHVAVHSNATAVIVEMLVKAYPEGVEALTNRGQTPLRLARRNKAPDAVLKVLDRLA